MCALPGDKKRAFSLGVLRLKLTRGESDTSGFRYQIRCQSQKKKGFLWGTLAGMGFRVPIDELQIGVIYACLRPPHRNSLDSIRMTNNKSCGVVKEESTPLFVQFR
jgi:hypothetical protein